MSRKTGYEMSERYQEGGQEGLSDRPRRPFRCADQLLEQVEAAIVGAKHTTRPRTRTDGTILSEGLNPNDLWSTDYRGELQIADKRYG